MNINEKYPILIGHSLIGNRRLHNTQEAAEFICQSAEFGDSKITYGNGIILLTTYGMYIDKVTDLEYRDELLKVLIPMQKKYAGDEDIHINGGSAEYIDTLNEKAEKYLASENFTADFNEMKRGYARAGINKTDEQLKDEAVGRFKTYCIKTDEYKEYEKLKKETKEYAKTPEFEADVQAMKKSLEDDGEGVPDNETLKRLTSEQYFKRLRLEKFREENGYIPAEPEEGMKMI